MPTLEFPTKISIRITGREQLGQDPSRRRQIAAGVLAGVALVLIYLHAVAEPKLQVSSNELDFAPVSVASSTATKTIKITNTGGAVLHVEDVGINGDAAAEYQAQTDCNHATVDPQRSCVVEVTLRPGEEGVRSAELVIANDSDQRVVRVGLSGTGVKALQADLTAEPLPLVFQQQVNTQVALPLVLHNTGNGTATITGISATNSLFMPTQDCVSKEVEAAATCDLTVGFAPSEAGDSPAMLKVEFIGNGETHELQVPIVAHAMPLVPPPPQPKGALAVDPPELDFNADNRGPAKVVVRNDGDGPLTINKIDIVKGADRFSMSKGCGDTVAAHGSCSFGVYSTSKDTGQWVGTLLISSVDDAKVVTLSASVAPVGVARIEVSPPRLVASSAQMERVVARKRYPDTATVVSEGSSPLMIGRIDFESPAFSQIEDNTGNTCAEKAKLDPGQRCAIRVGYRGDAGSATSRMLIYNNAESAPRVVSLIGIGQTAVARGTLEMPPEVEFGSVQLGRAVYYAAMVQGTPVVITNVGKAAVNFSPPVLKGDSTSFRQSGRCDSPLQPGATCTLRFAFVPTREGDVTATLEMDNDGSALVVSSTLHGVGVNPAPKSPAAPTGLKATVVDGAVTGKRAMERVKVVQPQGPNY